MDRTTIAAIATPVGSGGIGIIKMSGDIALRIASAVFTPSGASRGRAVPRRAIAPDAFRSHHLYHGHIIDPDTGDVLDEVLLSAMRSPNSYTCEDVVEINAHSGPVVLRTILELLLRLGAQLAEPGEFTRRAFLNGRIDLTQAEGVIDIINARSEQALQIATAQVQGELGRQVEWTRGNLLDLLTGIEAAIDFPEEVEDTFEPDQVGQFIESHVLKPLDVLIEQYNSAHLIRDGLKLAVIGRPNVGKSSLLNRFLLKDRAIVTAEPGTTRDLIEETLTIQGVPVILTDTAGIHETVNPVEVIGINRTLDCMRDADLVLFLIDASDPFTSAEFEIYESIRNKSVILAVNKMDLAKHPHEPSLPDEWGAVPVCRISAKTGLGIEALKKTIVHQVIGGELPDLHNTIVPNLRQKQLLEQSRTAAAQVVKGCRAGLPHELLAIDLQEAVDLLGSVIGVTLRQDVIDQIFSRFCIGK